MGAFFTNVHVCRPRGVAPAAFAARVRAVVETRLAGEGFAITDGPADREILIASAGRWLAVYDARAEDQDDTVETWARDLSRALDTEAFCVLVHDSDVLELALFTRGTLRDRFDSNPGFSGKAPDTITPEARARSWASLLVPGRDAAELAATFASKAIFAEAALAVLAPAIGADPEALSTGYNYLSRDKELPATVVRVCATLTTRPAWERRLSGPPRLGSQWESFETEMSGALKSERPPEPERVLVGQRLHTRAMVKDPGGAARGLRIAIEASSDCVELTHVEAVIGKSGGSQMERYPAPLTRVAGRWVAELPDAALQPGFNRRDTDALVGAPRQAKMEAYDAGQIHLNIFGTARHPGHAELAVELVPLANPAGSHVERVVIDVIAAEGVPLRAPAEVHAYMIDRLTDDANSYLLVLVDAPIDRVKAHAIELLASIRSIWPEERWHAFASDERAERSEPITPALANPWPVLEAAVRATRRDVTARLAARGPNITVDACGFEVDISGELGAIAIWLARGRTDQAAAERALTAAVDAIAREGMLVQAVLARWRSEIGGVTTPYEDVVRIHGDHLATRGWATRWVRGIGRGQLWLGDALRGQLPAMPPDAIELGAALRLPVPDVAAAEALLGPLLPTAAQSHACARAVRDPA